MVGQLRVFTPLGFFIFASLLSLLTSLMLLKICTCVAIHVCMCICLYVFHIYISTQIHTYINAFKSCSFSYFRPSALTSCSKFVRIWRLTYSPYQLIETLKKLSARGLVTQSCSTVCQRLSCHLTCLCSGCRAFPFLEEEQSRE